MGGQGGFFRFYFPGARMSVGRGQLLNGRNPLGHNDWLVSPPELYGLNLTRPPAPLGTTLSPKGG